MIAISPTRGADMRPHIDWLVEWNLVSIMGNTIPPRDPDDDDDDDEEEDDEDDEPPVIREPDEGE
jgi:hypothetical protein